MDLIRSFSREQYSQALESWEWRGIGPDKLPVFASPFGDLFFRGEDGFWYLDTIEATLTRPWESADDLKAELDTQAGQDRYLLASLAAAADLQGIVPDQAQVYGLRIPPVLGGEIDVSNLEVIDFVVSVNLLGQIHAQFRGLP
jgi:T6SS immunity protein Tdi1, C-terminal